MIANYGYKDAEGEFYLTINTDHCVECPEKPCVAACPQSILIVEEDPYGDEVVAVDDAKRKKLKYECSGCKPNLDRPPLPCVAACPTESLRHSW